MSYDTTRFEFMEGLDMHFTKFGIAKPKVKVEPVYVPEFHPFKRLPVELQDLIWEFALPSEIINSDQVRRDRNEVQYPGIPAIASVCKGSRAIALRYGAWLTTPQSSKPMFFIPDCSVLYCDGGIELTVTANQVMLGLDPILMRMAVHFNARNQLLEILILASDGKPGKIPGTWHKTSDGRIFARVEICDLDARGPTRHRMYGGELYCPRIEWTAKRWEEIKTAAKRAWLLAAWHVQDPIDVREQDILDPSQWFSGLVQWIPRELSRMPALTAAYLRHSI
ncbi:hypothetical protein F5Y12DRAFT_744396 [Xylaria sp. FL1777]|nr:hypothetical protein F5Y12DRAFT_744396 [Xylaria sp. FL1777]